MCMSAPKLPAQNAPPPPPPPAPPPPAPTATGLTVGDARTSAPPIKNYLKKALGAQQNSLVVPLGGTVSTGTGLSVPTGV